jgi:hypothetical protein
MLNTTKITKVNEGQILHPHTTLLLCWLFYVFAWTWEAAILPLVLIYCTFKHYRTLEVCKLSVFTRYCGSVILCNIKWGLCVSKLSGSVKISCLKLCIKREWSVILVFLCISLWVLDSPGLFHTANHKSASLYNTLEFQNSFQVFDILNVF